MHIYQVVMDNQIKHVMKYLLNNFWIFIVTYRELYLTLLELSTGRYLYVMAITADMSNIKNVPTISQI